MEESIREYENLKMFRKYKYIIFKAVPGGGVVVDKLQEPHEGFKWKDFTDQFPANEPRFAVVDLQRKSDGKFIPVFIDWFPEESSSVLKMLAGSSRGEFVNNLSSLGYDIKVQNLADIDEEKLTKKLEKMISKK